MRILTVSCVSALFVASAFVAGDARAQRQRQPDPTPQAAMGFLPLTDLADGQYLGFAGGLYPGGSNTIPPAHLAAGIAMAKKVQPLDGNGNPDAQNGKTVLLSIGMSNTTQEFCMD